MSHAPSLSPLLDHMLALPVREREAWIESLDAEHDGFKPALRGLLEATYLGDTTKPLEDDAAWQAWPAETRRLLLERIAADEQPGSRVGPYRLLRPLGQGGMGTVWLAERADGSLKRQVALKLPILGPQRLKQGERFARERDILAALVHPNIARLYDAGVADDGQPYLAMEPIAGEPITAYAQGKSVEQRIGLFRQVLAAVQHAHSQLVVHRDLKPSNILVDAQGQVHLLDFGIALLLDQPGGGDALTEVGQAVLTPNYASPEQIAGQPLGTASDLYSLGVVLYELLSRSKPYRPTRDTRAALEEAVLTGDPLPPSRAPGLAPAVAKRLRGDLDNIVLKALRKVPAERYASAEAFSADLQRHLDGVPVLAHPPSLAYRARKFVGRNRVWVGTGAFAAFALVSGSVATAWQAREADVQRRAAQQQAAAALQAGDEARAQTARADAALQRALSETARAEANAALAQAQSERADLRTNEALAARRQSEQSAARARAEAAKALATKDFLLGVFEKNKVGDGNTNEGQNTTARQLLETGSERLLADTTMPRDVRFELLGTLGSLTHNLGLNDLAAKLHVQALALAKELHGPRSPQYWQAAWDRGSGLVMRGDYAHAREVLGDAVASMEATPNGRHDASYASSLMFLGIVAYNESRLPDSRDLLQRSVAAFAADHPQHAMRPGALRWLGTAHRTLEEFGPAEQRLRESLAVAAGSQGLKDFSAASVHYALGDLYARLGRYADAAPAYEQAHRMQATAMGARHTATGLAALELGRTQHQLGRRDEGYASLAEAGEIALTEQSPRPGNMNDRVRFALAQMHVDDGDSGPALALARETVQRLRPLGGINLASTLLVQAEAELLAGDAAAADASALEAQALVESKMGREHSQARVARQLRAESLLLREQPSAAAALLQPLAVPTAGDAPTPRSVWLLARARLGLAEALLASDAANAGRLAREAVAPMPATTPVLRERVVLARAKLVEGRAWLAQQRRDEARQATAAAVALLDSCQVPGSPRLAEARRQLAGLAP